MEYDMGKGNKKYGTQSNTVDLEFEVFKQNIFEHEIPKSEIFLDNYTLPSQIFEHMFHISTQNISILAQLKKIARINRGMLFHCFVLNRKPINSTLTDEEGNGDEVIAFLDKLATNLEFFPAETRFQLAISDDEHWYAIDIFIKDGTVNSFILDAAGDERFCEIRDELIQRFPGGSHYSFEVSISDENKILAIQKTGEGCGIFAYDHIEHLSRIPAETLYSELKESATNEYICEIWDKENNQYIQTVINQENTITIDSIQANTHLACILRPSTSYSLLEELDNDLKNTVINKNEESLIESAYNHKFFCTINGKGREVNGTIYDKSETYRDKLIEAVTKPSSSELVKSVLARRTGFTYLDHPRFFEFEKNLCEHEIEDIQNILKDIYLKLEPIFLSKNNPTIFSKDSHFIKMQETFNEIISLVHDDTYDKGELIDSSMRSLLKLREQILQCDLPATILILLDDAINTTLCVANSYST